MTTYRVVMDITAPTNPQQWNWDNFLNLDEGEDYSIVSIEKESK